MQHDSLEPRLLIAADDMLARAGLAALLTEAGCHVSARVSGEQLADALERLSPDMLVVDLGWSASGSISRLHEIDADLPLLLLAQADDEALAAALVAARQFPCFALLPRTSTAETIMAAVDSLMAGLIALAPDFARLLINDCTERACRCAQSLDGARKRSVKLAGGRLDQPRHRPAVGHHAAYGQVSCQCDHEQAGCAEPHRSGGARHTTRSDCALGR